MQTFFRSIQKFSTKFSAISVLAIVLIFGGTGFANANESPAPESREQAVDGITDWLFGNLHPELDRRRKIQPNESDYIRDWSVIRSVIDQADLPYDPSGPTSKACAVPAWTYPIGNQVLMERLADAIFYSRNPERNGQPIDPNDRAAVREWLKLKAAMRHVAYC